MGSDADRAPNDVNAHRAAGLVLERRAIASMDRASYNPRVDLKPSDLKYQQISESIRQFGYVESIVWNRRTNCIVAGHQRISVLEQDFGCTEVDVSVVDVDVAMEREMNVALNNIDGEWDGAKLALMVREWSDAGTEMSRLGFESDQVAAMLAMQEIGEEKPGSSTDPIGPHALLTVVVTCEHAADQQTLLREFKARGLNAARGST